MFCNNPDCKDFGQYLIDDEQDLKTNDKGYSWSWLIGHV